METFLEQRLKEIEGNYKCGNCTLTKQPILFQHQSFVHSFRKLKHYKQVPNKTLQNETLPGAVQSKIQYYFKKNPKQQCYRFSICLWYSLESFKLYFHVDRYIFPPYIYNWRYDDLHTHNKNLSKQRVILPDSKRHIVISCLYILCKERYRETKGKKKWIVFF